MHEEKCQTGEIIRSKGPLPLPSLGSLGAKPNSCFWSAPWYGNSRGCSLFIIIIPTGPDPNSALTQVDLSSRHYCGFDPAPVCGSKILKVLLFFLAFSLLHFCLQGQVVAAGKSVRASSLIPPCSQTLKKGQNKL